MFELQQQILFENATKKWNTMYTSFKKIKKTRKDVKIFVPY